MVDSFWYHCELCDHMVLVVMHGIAVVMMVMMMVAI